MLQVGTQGRVNRTACEGRVALPHAGHKGCEGGNLMVDGLSQRGHLQRPGPCVDSGCREHLDRPCSPGRALCRWLLSPPCVCQQLLLTGRPACPPQDIQRFYNTVVEELPANIAGGAGGQRTGWVSEARKVGGARRTVACPEKGVSQGPQLLNTPPTIGYAQVNKQQALLLTRGRQKHVEVHMDGKLSRSACPLANFPRASCCCRPHLSCFTSGGVSR